MFTPQVEVKNAMEEQVKRNNGIQVYISHLACHGALACLVHRAAYLVACVVYTVPGTKCCM